MFFSAKEFAARRATERADQLQKQEAKERQTQQRQEDLVKAIAELLEQLRTRFQTLADEYSEATPVPADRIAIAGNTAEISQSALAPSSRPGWQARLHQEGLLATLEKDRIWLQFYTAGKEERLVGGQLHTLMPIVEAGQISAVVKLEGTNGQLLLRSNDREELLDQVAALCLFKLVNLADDKLLDLNESLNITPENIRLQVKLPALK